jgi:hypothetical protein
MRRRFTDERLDVLMIQAESASGKKKAGMTAEEFASSAPPRKQKGIRPTSEKDRARYESEVANFVQERDWSRTRPGHLVALYLRCHAQVYRVPPLELDDGKEYALATIAATRFARDQFGGSLEDVVRYMQWAWHREQGREAKRVQQGTGGVRLGWRWFFSASMATDYRVANARDAAR